MADLSRRIANLPARKPFSERAQAGTLKRGASPCRARAVVSSSAILDLVSKLHRILILTIAGGCACLAWPMCISAQGASAPDESRSTSKAATIGASQNDPAAVEFFERRIRPVLAGSCFACHAQGTKNKGGLNLATRDGMLQGGRRGPAVVPGDPDSSLLLKAIRRLPDSPVKMPPKEPLPAATINDFASWIASGAVWTPSPSEGASETAAEGTTKGTAEATLPGDWALQPVSDPPAPAVQDQSWPKNDLDRFVRARLEQAGLRPAAPIDRRSFIRRVTFDLIGLPPTAAEIDNYLNDEAADADSRLVDRLLTSPHYGERWARHWLDVVRYAETDGHEFDVDKPNAFRYRDYVIEAFNRDLPFDQFVREQIAGDLIPQEAQRTSADGATRLAPIGSGFWYLGEVQNTPVDERQDRANQVENQLDVFGKAFLGLTLACARCHDHKFDPIPTADYYALAGFVYSSGKRQACVDGLSRQAQLASDCAEIVEIDRELASLTAVSDVETRLASAERLAELLLAAREVLQEEPSRRTATCQEVAKRRSIDEQQLGRLVSLVDAASDASGNFLWLWRRLVSANAQEFAHQLAAIARDPAAAVPAPVVAPVGPAVKSPPEVFATFDQPSFDQWEVTGAAFGDAPAKPAPGTGSGAAGAGVASSGRVSGKLTGRLVSPVFTIKRPFIWFRIAGANDPANCRISLVVNGQPLGLLTQTGRGDRHLEQRYFDVHELLDREVFLEIVDEAASDDGFIVVDEIQFADAPPPGVAVPVVWQELLSPSVSSPESLAARYQQLVLRDLRFHRDALERNDVAATTEIARWGLRSDVPLRNTVAADLVAGLPESAQDRVVKLLARRAQLERELGPSAIAIVACDTAPKDIPIQQRGEASQPGEVAPRGFLTCIDALESHRTTLVGSGRTELAEWVASPRNPLTARVFVNRIWLHYFGHGLVGTPDNFGEMGERPTQPELLDFLASRFVESGWSVKALHRLIALSATYRQGNQTTVEALQQDPENRLLHHMPLRRLDAECLRDAMLVAAGNLNASTYGPSVKLHLTPYMDGQDLPKSSGPLDGDRRRSIYLEVRRNHLTPLLAVFNFPRPLNATGQRIQAIVPAQAISLMNNAFVVHQAEVWGTRELAAPGEPTEKVRRMFEAALGRPPDDFELRESLAFLAAQRAARAAADSVELPEAAAWADLAHALFVLPEFQLLR